MKQSLIEAHGTIKEALGDSNFRVELDNGHEILCQISGRMRKSYIRVLPGDNVKVEISPYDISRGRIVSRENTVKPKDEIKRNKNKKKK